MQNESKKYEYKELDPAVLHTMSRLFDWGYPECATELQHHESMFDSVSPLLEFLQFAANNIVLDDITDEELPVLIQSYFHFAIMKPHLQTPGFVKANNSCFNACWVVLSVNHPKRNTVSRRELRQQFINFIDK